jgi:nitrogen-specific signal transduction histidine kinase
MKIFESNSRLKWILFIIAFALIGYFLYELNTLINQLRIEEKKKIELWANAISRKSSLVEHTENFFNQVKKEERKRVEQIIEAHRVILQQPLNKELENKDLDFYFRVISENKTIPVIITDEFNYISLTQNVELPKDYKVLVGDLYKEFTKNPPLEYEIYGMKLKLYYTESKVYNDLHVVLLDLSSSLLKEATNNYVFVPVIITDSSHSKIYASGNISKTKLSPKNLENTLSEMESSNKPISIKLPDKKNALVFYEESSLLIALKYYPIFFICISIIIIFIAYQLFSTIKRSEQNSVWAGMSKETAHQLGTPISSLMAWVEYLKLNPENESTCLEITKDIHRLETITQRFSKIGSNPELKKQDLIPIINNAVDYLRTRSSKKVNFNIILPQDKAIILPLNEYLLEWVLENLCKNAIDAMEGIGEFKILLIDENKRIHLDISDTGKGIPKSCHKKIFKPGYSSKKRGWGLGLSLAKRIIEEYHNGRIYVKQSVIGKGTTFRITFYKKDF